MCSVCAGTVCSGSGGCQVVGQAAKVAIQNPQPVVHATINYAQTSVYWVQSVYAAVFTLFQDFSRNSKVFLTNLFYRKG